MQTHLVPKIMHQNLTIILQQFNYSKNSFIVLVPGEQCPVIFQISFEAQSCHRQQTCNANVNTKRTSNIYIIYTNSNNNNSSNNIIDSTTAAKIWPRPSKSTWTRCALDLAQGQYRKSG